MVYLATHLALDVPRALKLITPGHDVEVEAELRERFRREARHGARIEHPNVVPVYDYGEQDGLLYVTMRYVDGLSLRELVLRDGPLQPFRASAMLADLPRLMAMVESRGGWTGIGGSLPNGGQGEPVGQEPATR